MLNPATHDETVTLKNGQEVRLRAVRPSDKGLVLEMFRKLDPESIYTRFFHAKKLLTDGDLKMITEVDFEKVVAFVGTVGSEGSETMVCGARYARHETDGRIAELAFIVADDYQGQGLASMLLQRLAHIAREKGVVQFEADVLAQNRAMRAVFSRSGLRVQEKSEGDSIRITLSLTEEAS